MDVTTFTIDKEISFKKTHFKDIEELRHFLDAELDEDFDIGFRSLEAHEITPAMRRRVAKIRKLPSSRFVNLTNLHAHNKKSN